MRARLRAAFTVLGAFEAATGVYLFCFPHLSRSYLACVLAHLVLGVITVILLAILALIWGRGLLQPQIQARSARSGTRSTLRSTKVLVCASLAVLALTGIFLGAHGALGLGKAALGLHLFAALVFFGAVDSYAVRQFRRGVWSFGGLRSRCGTEPAQTVALLILIFTSAGFINSDLGYAPRIARIYNFKFGANPFAPGQARTSTGTFLPADQFPSASYCARCHAGAHEQWRESAHRNSFREPFYKKNVDLFIKHYGMEVTRHCESCHNPIALVSGALTTGSTLPRPSDDEGVTCTVCHSITRVTSLEGVGSYELAAPVLLLEEDGTPFRSRLNDELILLKPELHKKAMMKDLYRTPEFCAACHKSALPKEIDHYKWRRPFSAYDEWQASAHSNEALLPFYKKPRNTCQTCHMSAVQVARDMAAKKGKLASHRWAAANTAIPFYYGFRAQLEAVEQFLKDRRLMVDILSLQKGPAYPSQRDATDLITLRKGAAGPRIGEGFTTINAINTALYPRARGAAPLIAPIDKREFTLRAGDTVTVGVVVANPGVGHLFPTELRDFYEPWVEFKVVEANGAAIYHSGFLKQDGRLDEKAHIFQSIQVTEKAEWVRHHNIWETRGKAYDNFIAPGRSELVRYQFTIPRSARGPLHLSARVLYRRFNRFYSNWVLGRSVDYPIVEMARKSITLQLGLNTPGTVALDETDKIRFNNLGIALFDQLMFPEAREAFEMASRIDPSYADAYVNQAIAEFRLEKFREMHSLLAKALQLDPENARAAYYEAALLRMENHAADAAGKLERLGARFPRDRFVWNQLGECYQALHQTASARAAFEKTLEIDPDDITALYFLPQVYRSLGLPDVAAQTNITYLDKFEDWRIHYLANQFISSNDVARAEAVPWHVHADVGIPTPKNAVPLYWASEGAPFVEKEKK